MADLVQLLQDIGFTEYEAKSYISLVRSGPVTGYELARLSRIPRPNIYRVLEKLVERGAALRLEAPDGARYVAVAPDEVLRGVGSRFQATLDQARDSLAELEQPAQDEFVWNASGYEALLAHATSVIESAQQQLLLAVWPAEAQALAPSVAAAEGRGVRLLTLCLAACAAECGGCRGHLFRYRVAPPEAGRWLVVVADRTELLAGEVAASGEAHAVRTRQPLLVSLGEWYIRHSAALATVLGDVGGHLDNLLAPEAQARLATLGPGGVHGGWLEHMRALLARPPARPKP